MEDLRQYYDGQLCDQLKVDNNFLEVYKEAIKSKKRGQLMAYTMKNYRTTGKQFIAFLNMLNNDLKRPH